MRRLASDGMTSSYPQTQDTAAVRKRPGMFVGDTDSRAGTEAMFSEVLANSLDEVLAGRCTQLDVTLHSDGSVSVVDNGAGIAIDPDESGTPWIERVLTTLHTTATADGHAPHIHLRRNHTGLCMVAALSSSLCVEVRRGGQRWRMETEKGIPTGALKALGPCDTTGTTVRFRPDSSIFAQPVLLAETVSRRLRELSAFVPGLRTSFACEPQVLEPGDGIEGLIPRGRSLVRGSAQRGHTTAQVAFSWTGGETTGVVGYCNLRRTPRGAHIEGFRRGLAAALGRRDYAKVYKALSPGLNAVVSVFVVDPTYRNPTPEHLISKDALAVVKEATAMAFREALSSDPRLRSTVSAAGFTPP